MPDRRRLWTGTEIAPSSPEWNTRIRRILISYRAGPYPLGDDRLDDTTPLNVSSSFGLLNVAAALAMPQPPDGSPDGSIAAPVKLVEGRDHGILDYACGADIDIDTDAVTGLLRAMAAEWGIHTSRWPEEITIGELRAVLTKASIPSHHLTASLGLSIMFSGHILIVHRLLYQHTA